MKAVLSSMLVSLVLTTFALAAPTWYRPKVDRIVGILGFEAEFLKEANHLIDSAAKDGAVTLEFATLMRSELKSERYVAEVASVFLGRYSEAEIDQIAEFFEEPSHVKIYQSLVSAFERSNLDEEIRDLAARDPERFEVVRAFFTSPVAEKVNKTINDVRAIRSDFVVSAVIEADKSVRRSRGKAAQPGATDKPAISEASHNSGGDGEGR